MRKIIEDFFNAYCNSGFVLKTPFTKGIPKEMMVSEVNSEGNFVWRPIVGTLTYKDYQKIEERFNVVFPKSFIEWHKAYFFLDADLSVVRLPFSEPHKLLQALIDELDYNTAKELVEMGLYPFGQNGGDIGPLVFDARYEVKDNEFPIRYFDYGYGIDGLSEIIFSSFSKLLECLIHFLNDTRPGGYEAIYDFLAIDPEGAGKTGVDYWLQWAEGTKWNYERED